VEAQRRSRLEILRRVRRATQSHDPTLRLEGRIARRLRRVLRAFQQEIRVQGRRVGEIDVELETVIIEVASGKGRKKFQQVQRLLHNRALNPAGKPVVVFGPQLRGGLVRQLEESGVKVVRTLAELEAWGGQT
jgi:hypothetical protein